MPLVGERTGQPIEGKAVQQWPTAPSFLQTAGAALQHENIIGALLLNQYERRIQRESSNVDRPFNIDTDAELLKGYEDFDRQFVFAETLTDVERIKRQIDKERENIATLAAAGTQGVLLMMGSAMLDPIYFAVGAGVGKSLLTTGSRAMRLRMLAATVGEAAVAETALQLALNDRTAEQTAFSLAGAAFLAGIVPPKLLGAGARRKVIQRLEEDMTLPPAGALDPFVPEGTVHIPRVEAAGAAVGDAAEAGGAASAADSSAAAARRIAALRRRAAAREAAEAEVLPQPGAGGGGAVPPGGGGSVGPPGPGGAVGPVGPAGGGPLPPPSVRQTLFREHFGDKVFNRLFGRLTPLTRILLHSHDDEIVLEALKVIESAADVPGVVAPAVETIRNTIERTRLARMLRADEMLWLKHIGDPNWDKVGELGARPVFRTNVERAKDFLGNTVVGDFVPALRREGKLTFREFQEEIGRALRHGDEQQVPVLKTFSPEVEEAAKRWRKEFFEHYRERGRAINAIEGVPGYYPRVYNRQAIVAHSEEFLARAFTAIKFRHPDIDDATAHLIARDIQRHILNDPRLAAEHNGISVKYTPHGSRNFRERRFYIPDSELDGTTGGVNFLVDSVEHIAHGYHRGFVSDLLLAERWGTADIQGYIDNVIKQMNERYEQRWQAATGQATREAIRAQHQSDIRDFQGMIDIYRHRYRVPGAETGYVGEGAARVLRAARAHNVARIGGGFTPSAIPDIGKLAFHHGTKRLYGDIVANLIDGLQRGRIRIAMQEADAFGLAAEIELNARAAVVMDIGELGPAMRPWERTLSNVATTAMFSTGLQQWNLVMKRMGAVLTQSRLLEIAEKVEGALKKTELLTTTPLGPHGGRLSDLPKAAALSTQVAAVAQGALTKADLAMLSRLNLTIDDLPAFLARFRQHGEMVGQARWARVSDWADDAVTHKFLAAVRKDVDTMIVTPSIGDLPLSMQAEGYIKTILQFKSFGVASMNRTMRVGLQEADRNKVEGLGIMFALGLVTYATKELAKDPNGPRFQARHDPIALAYEAVDRSGAFGFLGDINNSLQRVTGNKMSIQRLFGSGIMSTRGSRPNVLGTLLGPTADTINGVAVAGTALWDKFANGDPMSRYERGQLRRLAPLQNIWHGNMLWNAAADSIDWAAEGLKEKSK